MQTDPENSSDPAPLVRRLQGQFQELIDHLRADVGRVGDPRARAMFAASAEVLTGLRQAFLDYAKNHEGNSP